MQIRKRQVGIICLQAFSDASVQGVDHVQEFWNHKSIGKKSCLLSP